LFFNIFVEKQPSAPPRLRGHHSAQHLRMLFKTRWKKKRKEQTQQTYCPDDEVLTLYSKHIPTDTDLKIPLQSAFGIYLE